MHSNSPLHLYSVYLLYIYTYRRYTSIYTYIYGTSVRCQKHFDLRRLSPNYSLCIFNSAFSVHLSVSPPLAPPPSHSVPCNSTQTCVRMCVCYWLWGESVSGSAAMRCDVVAYLWFVSGSFRIGKFAFWFFFFTCSLQLCLPACCLCCPLAVAHVVFIRKFFSFLLRHTRHTFPPSPSLFVCVFYVDL